MPIVINRDRITSREIVGSPRYIYINPATNQNVSWNVTFEDTAPSDSTAANVSKYLPFNFITVTNKSGSTLYFYKNQDLNQISIITDGSSKSFEGEHMNSFRIVPTTANAAINTIWVECMRQEMTSNKFFRDVSKNVFARALLGY